MSTVATRLKTALEFRGRSGQWLETVTAGMPGDAEWPRGYASYVINDKRTPGVAKLASAAEKLAVNFEWLATGKGTITQSAESRLLERNEILEAVIAAEGFDDVVADQLRRSYDSDGISRGREWIAQYGHGLKREREIAAMRARVGESEPVAAPDFADHELDAYKRKQIAKLDKSTKPKPRKPKK